MLASLQRPTRPAATSKPKTSTKQDAWMDQWIAGNNNKPAAATLTDSSSLSEAKPITSEQPTDIITVAVVDSESRLSLVARSLSLVNDDTAPSQQRLAALKAIATALNIDTESNNATVIPQSVYDAVLTSHCKSLLRRFTDSSESCRHRAISIILALLERCTLAIVTTQLPYVIPVLTLRMNVRELTAATQPYSAANQCLSFPLTNDKNAEGSEEIRSLLLSLVNTIVKRCDRNADVDDADTGADSDSENLLALFLPDLVTVLAQGIADRSPSIKQQSMTVLLSLATSQPQRLRNSSTILVRLAIPNLFHSHYRIRTQTISLLLSLIPLGATELIRDLAGFRESNVIDIHGFYHGETHYNHFARLVVDGHSSVRQSLYECIGRWLTTMVEASDYETLLMPYLLTGLHDSIDANRALCQRYLQQLGDRHEREVNDRNDKSREEYKYTQFIEQNDRQRKLINEQPFLTFDYQFAYQSRPSYGVRSYCQRFVDRFLPAIITELSDWQGIVQCNSLLLLRSLLFFAEEKTYSHLTELVTAMLVVVGRLHFNGGGETEKEDLAVMQIVSRDLLALIGRYSDTSLLLQRLILKAEAGQVREALWMAEQCMQTASLHGMDANERAAIEQLHQALQSLSG